MLKRLTNKITERCIRCDGIHVNRNIYQSKELQQLYLTNLGQLVQVIYDPADPTSIYVHAKHNPTSRYIHVPRTNLEVLSLHPRWKQQTGGVQFVPQHIHFSNEKWNMDFVNDILANGQLLRTSMVVNDVGRFSPASEISHSIKEQIVVALLERLRAKYGLPTWITVDNGREFISKVQRGRSKRSI